MARIVLAVPSGCDVVANRGPGLDHARENFCVTIRDACAVAGR